MNDDTLVASRINAGQVVFVDQGHEDDNFYGRVEVMYSDGSAGLVGGMVVNQDSIRALKITEVFGHEDS